VDEAGRRETGRGGAATRRRIVDAAIETLKAEGFAGASARAIARRGDFNQALIFYHFNSLHGLLLAVLDETSRRRLARWEEATGKAESLPELLATTAELYSEDLARGT
jgi:AcrR family transcriptional regulator